jgi:hypothetical protein
VRWLITTGTAVHAVRLSLGIEQTTDRGDMRLVSLRAIEGKPLNAGYQCHDFRMVCEAGAVVASRHMAN